MCDFSSFSLGFPRTPQATLTLSFLVNSCIVFFLELGHDIQQLTPSLLSLLNIGVLSKDGITSMEFKGSFPLVSRFDGQSITKCFIPHSRQFLAKADTIKLA